MKHLQLLNPRFFSGNLIQLLVSIGTLLLFFSACDDTSGGLEPIIDKPVQLETAGSVDSVANLDALRGGIYTTWGGPTPKTLNYWREPWHLSAEVMGLMYESLVSMHTINDEPVGDLARSWTRAADGRTFVFKIHPEAKWNDGKPVRAEDVQFYYDTIMNKKHLTTAVRGILSRFERPEVIDARTLKIVAKKRYWKAFWDAASFVAFPKHIWEGKDFNKINKEFPVVSGPYELAGYKRNRYVMMRRRADWWGRIKQYNRGKYNFDYIKYRLIENRTVALEKFKKGEMDLYAIYTSSIWVKKTGPESLDIVKNGWVVRQNVYTRSPLSYQGLALNLRRKYLQDKRVRLALAHLLNRKRINKELMHNEYLLLNTYFPFLYPGNINPAVSVRNFDKEKAMRLLDEAGWKIGPNGVRKKNGQPLVLKFLSHASDSRHMKLFQEDLKYAGVKLEIEQLTMAEVQKRVEDFQYDLYWVNTGASRLPDPENWFHSRFADEKGSPNLSGLKDPRVDALLDQLREETKLQKRSVKLARLDQILFDEVPFLLLWQSDKTRLLYWDKFDFPINKLGKYGDESSTIVYWSFNKDKKKKLRAMRKSGKPQKREPDQLRYTGP